MKKLIFVFAALQVICMQFSYAIDRDEVFDVLQEYLFFKKGMLPLNEKLNELDYIQAGIDEELDRDAEDVELLLLKGLSHCSYMRAYKAPLSEELDKKKWDYKFSCQKYLDSAITKNTKIKSLSYLQLVILKAYAGSDIIVKAVDQILITDHDFDDKERVELRRNKIDHLIRLNRFDDALHEMEKLNSDFPEYASKEWDEAFLGEIKKAKELKKKTSKLNEEPLKPEKTKEPEVKTAPSPISSQATNVEEDVLSPKLTSSANNNNNDVEAAGSKPWYLILVIMLVIGIVLLRYRQSRKQK